MTSDDAAQTLTDLSHGFGAWFLAWICVAADVISKFDPELSSLARLGKVNGLSPGSIALSNSNIFPTGKFVSSYSGLANAKLHTRSSKMMKLKE
jgi:hypothetical protein